MSDCLFCRIAAGEIPADIVYQDEKVVAFRDINPKAEVHLLLIPREHIDSLNAVTPAHDELLGYMLRLTAKLAREQGLADGYRTIVNTGPGGGQVIFHLHLHLLGGTGLPGFE